MSSVVSFFLCLFRFNCLSFLFLLCLLWSELPVWCWVTAVLVGTFLCLPITEEKLLTIHDFLWRFLGAYAGTCHQTRRGLCKAVLWIAWDQGDRLLHGGVTKIHGSLVPRPGKLHRWRLSPQGPQQRSLVASCPGLLPWCYWAHWACALQTTWAGTREDRACVLPEPSSSLCAQCVLLQTCKQRQERTGQQGPSRSLSAIIPLYSKCAVSFLIMQLCQCCFCIDWESQVIVF